MDNDNGTVLICDCTCGYEEQKSCGHKWDGLTIEFEISLYIRVI